MALNMTGDFGKNKAKRMLKKVWNHESKVVSEAVECRRWLEDSIGHDPLKTDQRARTFSFNLHIFSCKFM